MATKPYSNFDLQLKEVGDSYEVQVIDSPAGQASHPFSLPFSALELELFILKIGQNRGAVRSLHLGNVDIPSVKKLGGALYDCLFSGEVAERFRTSLALAEREGNGLRIRLRLSGAPTLINIPWELLFDKANNNYLGLSVNTPVIRKLDLTKQPSIRQATGVLRVLVMISSPAGYYPLDVEREWGRIKTATENLQAEGRLVLDRVEPSLAELQRTLRRGEYHVFHYIGHGGFDSQNNDGLLVLEDKDKKAHLVSGQYLGALLHDETTLQLVLLNSCSGGRTSVTDPFAGVGQSLLQKGIPAVIAMQFEITDEAAITFSHEFYAALADGYPIDAAVAEARKMIYAQSNQLEWATPVLYTSVDGGSLLSEPMAPAVRPAATLPVDPPQREEEPRPEAIPQPQNSEQAPGNIHQGGGGSAWKAGVGMVLAILAMVIAVIVLWKPEPLPPEGKGALGWGVIYGSDKSISGNDGSYGSYGNDGGAKDSVANASKAGLTDVAIYYHKPWYHTVVMAADESTANQLLPKVRRVQKAEGRSAVGAPSNIAKWCPQPIKKVDPASKIGYFDCSSTSYQE
jgi:hypothetical protein